MKKRKIIDRWWMKEATLTTGWGKHQSPQAEGSNNHHSLFELFYSIPEISAQSWDFQHPYRFPFEPWVVHFESMRNTWIWKITPWMVYTPQMTNFDKNIDFFFTECCYTVHTRRFSDKSFLVVNFHMECWWLMVFYFEILFCIFSRKNITHVNHRVNTSNHKQSPWFTVNQRVNTTNHHQSLEFTVNPSVITNNHPDSQWITPL